MRRLTLAEAETLPEGTRVRIKWSGGNGPFWYKIHINKWGTRDVMTECTGQPDFRVDTIWEGTCIGPEEPFCIVEVED